MELLDLIFAHREDKSEVLNVFKKNKYIIIMNKENFLKFSYFKFWLT